MTVRRVLFGVVPLLLSALPAFGQASCKTFDPETRTVKGKLEPVDIVLYTNRTYVASFTLPQKFAERTLAFQGVVCDGSGEPRPDVVVDLVRYEGELPPEMADKPPRREFFEDGTLRIVTSHRLPVSDKGGIGATGLGPGKYALLVQWDNLASVDVQFVVFDLRRFYGLELSLSYGPASLQSPLVTHVRSEI